MPTITCNNTVVELLPIYEKFITNCPSCGNPLTRNGVNYFCVNHDCPDQVVERLKSAVGKGSLDIDGCGEAMIKVLIDNGVTDLVGLLSIEALPFDSAANRKFFIEREKAKTAPLWRKIRALGIDLVGTTMSKELSQTFSSLDEMAENLPKLKAILGPVKTQNFIDFINQNKDMIKKLNNLGFKLSEEKPNSGVLTGKSFVITGTMVTGKREDVQEKIESLGGVCKSSVGASTTYLIVGDEPGKSKVDGAKKKNVPMISESDLYAMIGEPMPTV